VAKITSLNMLLGTSYGVVLSFSQSGLDEVRKVTIDFGEVAKANENVS